RVEQLARLRGPRLEAGVVPENGAAVLCEREAVDDRAGFQLQLRGLDLQPHPLARRRQGTDLEPFGGAVLALVDQVLAPVGARRLLAGAPLEHDLLGRFERVEEDVGEEDVALTDAQARTRLLDRLPAELLGRLPEGSLAAVHR